MQPAQAPAKLAWGTYSILAGNVRTEPETGNRVMKEPEPEEPVTRTEPVEP